jgi:hypothetical protein
MDSAPVQPSARQAPSGSSGSISNALLPFSSGALAGGGSGSAAADSESTAPVSAALDWTFRHWQNAGGGSQIGTVIAADEGEASSQSLLCHDSLQHAVAALREMSLVSDSGSLALYAPVLPHICRFFPIPFVCVVGFVVKQTRCTPEMHAYS